MQGKRSSSCRRCRKRRFLRVRSDAEGFFSVRLRARKLCVRPVSSRIMFYHCGSWSPLRGARSARRKKL